MILVKNIIMKRKNQYEQQVNKIKGEITSIIIYILKTGVLPVFLQ